MSTMFVVSCRKDFWSATEFSTTEKSGNSTWTRVLALSSHPLRFEALAHKRITVLVPGYNNERLDVLGSYRTIDAHMRLLGFLARRVRRTRRSWALRGRAARPGCPSPVAAPMTRRAHSQLLAALRGGGATVDLNTHSLGAGGVRGAARGGGTGGAPRLALRVGHRQRVDRTRGTLLRRLKASGALLRLSL